MRLAAYYAPEPDDPLHTAGSAWLGRDATGAAHAAGPDLDPALTADARRYGLHATLKPPFVPRAGVIPAEIVAVLRDIAAATPAFALPPLSLDDWDGFLCLRLAAPSMPLQALCDAAVVALDPFRRPADAAELTRRRGGGLDPAREANLVRWGYPDVFSAWTFHITLTRRLDPPAMARVRRAAAAWFEPALATAREVRSVCLFTEATAGAALTLSHRVPLGGRRI